MERVNIVLRNTLWLFVTTIFIADLYKILSDISLVGQSAHQQFINKLFRSAFGLFELIMLCLIIFFIVKHPSRRLRLASLAFFHYLFIIILPMVFMDFTWMAVLFPWPQTLLAFDQKTSTLVLSLSLFVGFIMVPLLTIKWGYKGFCGYICPLGAFYSEAYGRLFKSHSGRFSFVRKNFPKAYFIFMLIALGAITIFPGTLDPVRKSQKLIFFITSQILYFALFVPLIGARSYCTHFCPLGYEVALIIRAKNNFRHWLTTS